MKNIEFIIKANEVHGDKYDYSMVEYKNNCTKVKIICPMHGVFEQTPTHHINRKQNCPSCTGHKKDTNLFISKAKKIHGDKYDYSKVEYISAKEKIVIVCSLHGEFKQTPNNHLKGKQCFYCTGTPKKSNDEFIEQATIKHNKKYDYSLVNYITREDKVKILCPIHGMFKQTPASHLNGGSGCPRCKDSKGENTIRDILIRLNIKYIPQKRFKNCRNILPLPFDFYLPDYNICIEYNGEQHYSKKHNFGSKKHELEQIQHRDKIKSDYCLNNNIPLLIIPYYENIEKTLIDFLGTYILIATT